MQHNVLREKVNKQATTDKSDLDKLTEYREETSILKVQISKVENKLIQLGVDPSQQSGYKSESESESDRYSDSSSHSSDTSEARPNKRVKFFDSKDNVNMNSVFPVFNLMCFPLIIRVLSVIASGVFLLVLHLDILPDLMVPLINISLVDLLSLYLIVNLIKLMYKMYNTILIIYNSYLNGNYMVIYANLFFSIIIVLWYFSG